eukprot:6383351-Amphidinium_carterae.1
MEPGFLWLVAYTHGHGRQEVERDDGKHCLRRLLPWGNVVKESFQAAQLQDRALHSTAYLNWSTSATAERGCYLHSLVQVRAGHNRLS